MAEIIEMPTTAIHGEIVAGDAAKIRKQLETLISTMNRSLFDLAELLYKVKSEGYYAGYGFDTFKEYLKSLDITERRGQYLTKMVEVMTEVGINRTEYEPLGIAKLREITSLDPRGSYLDPKDNRLIPLKEFIEGFVEEGQSMTLREIQTHVRTLKGLSGDNELVFVTLCMKKSVKESVWLPAIEKARKNIGDVGRDPETGDALKASDGRCAEVVAIEYLNNPCNDAVPPSYEGDDPGVNV